MNAPQNQLHKYFESLIRGQNSHPTLLSYIHTEGGGGGRRKEEEGRRKETRGRREEGRRKVKKKERKRREEEVRAGGEKENRIWAKSSRIPYKQ